MKLLLFCFLIAPVINRSLNAALFVSVHKIIMTKTLQGFRRNSHTQNTHFHWLIKQFNISSSCAASVSAANARNCYFATMDALVSDNQHLTPSVVTQFSPDSEKRIIWLTRHFLHPSLPFVYIRDFLLSPKWHRGHLLNTLYVLLWLRASVFLYASRAQRRYK